MKKVTQAQMMSKANKIVDYYDYLQQQSFYLMIDNFKHTKDLLKQANNDPTKIIEWRLKNLSQIGGLTDDAIKILSRQTGRSKRQIYEIIKKDGIRVTKQMNRQLAKALKKPVHGVSKDSMLLIDSFARQTWKKMDNHVNESLISRNTRSNAVAKSYRRILDKTVLNVTHGVKKPERALWDAVYQERNNGLTVLTDKGGHDWSLEGYTSTVINTTTARVYNDTRMQSMKEYHSGLAVMSSHPAARPACAEIQGQVVCTIDSSDPDYEDDYDNYPNIYDYGYGDPGGCFGINCQHMLYPYIEGVSHNDQEEYDPDEAVENEKIQQKQRYYERNVRANKKNLELAKRANDEDAIKRYSQSVRGYQGKIRKIVKDNDFLTRQYAREQIH